MNNQAANPQPEVIKFDGKAEYPTINAWCALFEDEVSNIQPAAGQIRHMRKCLQSVALEFYTTDILPDINVNSKDPNGAPMTLPEALRRMRNRFDRDVVSPLLAAQHLKQENKTIREYYEAKMVFLHKLSLADTHLVDQLTDGVNKELRNSLVCANIRSPSEWLQVASRLEVINKPLKDSQSPFKPKEYKQKTHCSVDHCETFKHFTGSRESERFRRNDNRNRRQQKILPKTPCKFCKAKGKELFHWHNECINRDPQPCSTQQSTQSPKQAVSNAVNHTVKITIPDEFIFFTTKVNKTRVSALMDTASTVNIINAQFAKQTGCKIIRKQTPIQLAGNKECVSPGLAIFDLTVDRVTKQISALCLPDFQYSILIGVNIREHFPFNISLKNLTVSLPKDEFVKQVLTANVDTMINRQPVNKELEKLLQEYIDVFDTKNEPV
ncbi:hypothetical protein B4U80_11959, partial [Leptotrombidium deliense]